MRRRRLWAETVIALLWLAALCGCESLDRNMWDTPAPLPQSEPVRLPPADSVPTKGKERIPPLSEAFRLANPVEPTAWNLHKGKELFGIFCVPCHGVSGKGDGPIAAKYVPTPVDIGPGSAASKQPDGVLFAIISSGSGGMPAFRHDLDPAERWMIVRHLRALKQTP